MVAATYDEIRAFVGGMPAASPTWVDALYTARLSLEAIEKLMVTMLADAASPLRESEEGMLNKEIMRINAERGVDVLVSQGNGKCFVKLSAVLSLGEQTRVTQLVGDFCQASFQTAYRFGRNGHTVMNAVRRAVMAYQLAKLPSGSSVIEVGPDVAGWITAKTPDEWVTNGTRRYKGARPVLGPRDAVRVRWEDLARAVERNAGGFWDEKVRDKVGLLRESYDSFFETKKIQDIKARGEYIISTDANYDIGFADMPAVMVAAGARAWFGTMVRAKGLTTGTRLKEGRNELMGVNFRVDWNAGRIDFRHPQCSAFGYSHNVWEYMKYEEHNGYVWSSRQADYVYTKGPETNAELLFFSVVRVPKLMAVPELRYVEDPMAGMLRVESVWSVGEEVNGLPTAFVPVVYHVDALNFSKVLEKRRALDFKGDLAVTTTLVKSTNVRMWLNGVPVGASTKIEANLSEATAVVVEALVAQGRLASNLTFERAMFVFEQTVSRNDKWWRFLETLVDFRSVVGKVAGPVSRVWQSMRGAVIDAALSPLAKLRVSVMVVEPHVRLESGGGFSTLDVSVKFGHESSCQCAEVADVRAALPMAVGLTREALDRHLEVLEKSLPCKKCIEVVDENIKRAGADSDGETTVGGSATSVNSGDDTDDADSVDSVVEVGPYWRSKECELMPERKSMEEYIRITEYLIRSELSECRIDATRIFESGADTDRRVKEYCTGRTDHALLKFMGGRCVGRIGVDIGIVGAVYDLRRDAIVPLRSKGEVMYGNLSDGLYYSCNRLKVWNGPDLIAAVSYALDYGVVSNQRGNYAVTLGVPGAGKTMGMMKKLAEEYNVSGKSYLVIAVTKASVAAAIKYGLEFGMSERWLMGRVMTLDRYLMHGKFPSDVVCADEFPMEHIAKFDAAVSIAGATDVRLCGDARQIPYDPFCAELTVEHSRLGHTVREDKSTFLPETHRLTEDTCAMWLDQYPSIYPCKCCRVDEKQQSSVDVVRIKTLDEVPMENDVRYHTYRQEDKEELISAKSMRGTKQELRAKSKGGIATVHEDQGSTHDKVVSVRVSPDYDRNGSKRNPSLFNRTHYVLTDTTRHKYSYVYYTMCPEDDMVVRRVAMAREAERRALVREEKGMGNVRFFDML